MLGLGIIARGEQKSIEEGGLVVNFFKAKATLQETSYLSAIPSPNVHGGLGCAWA